MVPNMHGMYIFLLSLFQTGIEKYNKHMDCITSYAKVETLCRKRSTVGFLPFSKKDFLSVLVITYIDPLIPSHTTYASS